MNKLLSASLLTLGAMCATPAAAIINCTDCSSWGIDLYIQDTSKPVIFTYGDLYNRSYAYDSNAVYVATIDANGKIVDNWQQLLKTRGTEPQDVAYLVSGSSALPGKPGDPYSFVYNVSPGAVELIFQWQDLSHSPQRYYHSGGVSDQVTYNYRGTAQTMLGLEDNFGNTVPPGGVDNDKNDVLIRMTNIGRSPPPVPEPETYAMMLAGLGLIGAVARRRRKGL